MLGSFYRWNHNLWLSSFILGLVNKCFYMNEWRGHFVLKVNTLGMAYVAISLV